jgi:hypothetical protein
MVTFDSAAIHADTRLQSIAATRLASIEVTADPARLGAARSFRGAARAAQPIGALALIVALASDVGVLVGLVVRWGVV